MSKTVDIFDNWWFLSEHDAFKVKSTLLVKKDDFFGEASKSATLNKLLINTNNYTVNGDVVEISTETSFFENFLDISVVKINPQKGEIDDDKSLNTKTEFWISTNLPLLEKGLNVPQRGNEINASGATFEEAIGRMADYIKGNVSLSKKKPLEIRIEK
ncbi:hypothetical protein [Photobacterium kishitanii]|uniref:Uncharacterized protein n=1 Tax=Photobacterium kishitanii TaxID=318456 RepID=A0A2T3KMH6_9GAMM|nr:hypothetical protein [Photobacterium kishitanii]PSV00991.1 hypothetical protein C9J27_02905 [Photobacterium kishitanii]